MLALLQALTATSKRVAVSDLSLTLWAVIFTEVDIQSYISPIRGYHDLACQDDFSLILPQWMTTSRSAMLVCVCVRCNGGAVHLPLSQHP